MRGVSRPNSRANSFSSFGPMPGRLVSEANSGSSREGRIDGLGASSESGGQFTIANSPGKRKFRTASVAQQADIRLSPRYINPARHVRAFRVDWRSGHERNDPIERGPGRAPAA